MPRKSNWVVETTRESFIADVVERSEQVPVVVDFWASWCQPCRMLGPVLERLAEEYAGQFELVKADTDQMPDIAGQFGVQSIPAVFALRGGEIVDGFVGVLSEPQLRAFLDKLQPSAAQRAQANARDMEAADPAAAEAAYRQVLAERPNDVPASVGLARALAAQDRGDEARSVLAALAESGLIDEEGRALLARLDLQQHCAGEVSVDELRAAAEASPADYPKQLELARALAASGASEEALKLALSLVQRDLRGTGEEARQLMLQLFDLLGPDHPLVSPYRRKLASALY